METATVEIGPTEVFTKYINSGIFIKRTPLVPRRSVRFIESSHKNQLFKQICKKNQYLWY